MPPKRTAGSANPARASTTTAQPAVPAQKGPAGLLRTGFSAAASDLQAVPDPRRTPNSPAVPDPPAASDTPAPAPRAPGKAAPKAPATAPTTAAVKTAPKPKPKPKPTRRQSPAQRAKMEAKAKAKADQVRAREAGAAARKAAREAAKKAAKAAAAELKKAGKKRTPRSKAVAIPMKRLVISYITRLEKDNPTITSRELAKRVRTDFDGTFPKFANNYSERWREHIAKHDAQFLPEDAELDDAQRLCRMKLASWADQGLLWSIRSAKILLDHYLKTAHLRIMSSFEVYMQFKALKLAKVALKCDAPDEVKEALRKRILDELAVLRTQATATVLKGYPFPRELFCNADQTPLYLYPGPTGSWAQRRKAKRAERLVKALDDIENSKSGRASMVITDAMRKDCVTCMPVVASNGALVHCQVIFKGKKVDTLCDNYRVKNPKISLIASESKWSSVDTMLQLFKAVEKYRVATINQLNAAEYKKEQRLPYSVEKTPIILLLDCAPVHTAAALRAVAAKKYPLVWYTFVPARATGYLQPLDVAFFGACKALMKKDFVSRLCKQLITGGKINVQPGKASAYARRCLVESLENVLAECEANLKLREHVAKAFDAIAPAAFTPLTAAAKNALLSAKSRHRMETSSGTVSYEDLYDIFRIGELEPATIAKLRRDLGLPRPLLLKRGDWGALPTDVRQVAADLAAGEQEAIDPHPRARDRLVLPGPHNECPSSDSDSDSSELAMQDEDDACSSDGGAEDDDSPSESQDSTPTREAAAPPPPPLSQPSVPPPVRRPPPVGFVPPPPIQPSALYYPGARRDRDDRDIDPEHALMFNTSRRQAQPPAP